MRKHGSSLLGRPVAKIDSQDIQEIQGRWWKMAASSCVILAQLRCLETAPSTLSVWKGYVLVTVRRYKKNWATSSYCITVSYVVLLPYHETKLPVHDFLGCKDFSFVKSSCDNELMQAANNKPGITIMGILNIALSTIAVSSRGTGVRCSSRREPDKYRLIHESLMHED